MSELTDLLLQGPRSAPELRQRLAISQATFSRLVAREDRVIRFGKARQRDMHCCVLIAELSVFPYGEWTMPEGA